MNYLSVCAGIEAATVAWHPLGWNPVAFSEIEKFPCKVLQYHYPDVPNYGDMNDFKKWPGADIDVLVGGTPCQSFSVAGLRAGMDDPRGNLALVYLAIAERYRPDWLVWENVPGVLSSDGGRDFAAIIGGMVKLGYGIAYRVLNAQYFGVPQRRRRVFVVGYPGDWRRAAKVLFEPTCMLRNTKTRKKTGQGSAPDVAKSIRGNSGGIDREDMHTLIPDTSKPVLSARLNRGSGPLIDSTLIPDVAPTLDIQEGSKRGSNQWVDNGHALLVPSVSRTLNAGAMGRKDYETETFIPIAFAQNQRDEVRMMDKAGALAAEPGIKQQTYVFEPRVARNDRGAPEAICPPLKAQSGKTGKGDAAPCVFGNMAVRRLTPLECERLQGFPDGYTDIPGASDSGRYKALGNSMAVPVMAWIGGRINEMC